VPVLGVEPAANCAEVAREKGVPTEVVFFGESTAAREARKPVGSGRIGYKVRRPRIFLNTPISGHPSFPAFRHSSLSASRPAVIKNRADYE